MPFDSFWDPNRIGNATHFGGILKSAGRVHRPEPSPQLEEAPPPEAAIEKNQHEKEKVILRNPKWEIEKVGFNEETEISVEAVLPEKEAHKTKVAFELFAKVPGKPERISRAEGQIKEGKATARIPVYIPQYRDEEGNFLAKVEYYFTSKHSASEMLEDSPIKLVDEMADVLIESHIIEDVTFATGKSQVHPAKAPKLGALAERIAAWKEKHPDGKLAVFGHADAVGKVEPNKALSERRAKCIYAFLMKDAAAWDALAQSEKWDQQAIPDYAAFMQEHNPLALTAKDFDVIDGKAFAGCSEFNQVESQEGAHDPNRRVAVFLLKSNKNFPIQYPCKHGDVGNCKAQLARKGARRTAGFGCYFYDKLVRETAQSSMVYGETPDYSDLPDTWLPRPLATQVEARLGITQVGSAERPKGEPCPLTATTATATEIKYWQSTGKIGWSAEESVEEAEGDGDSLEAGDEEEDVELD